MFLSVACNSMFYQTATEAGPWTTDRRRSMSTYSECSPQSAHNSGLSRESESQLWRYVPSPAISVELSLRVTRPRPVSAGHPALPSTTSTMMRFSPYSIFLDRAPSMRMNLAALGGGIGPVNVGGTSSCKCAGGGEASFSTRPLIWVFVSYVHLAHQSQICWPIRFPFHSSSTTSTVF